MFTTVLIVGIAIAGMVTSQPPPPDASCFQPDRTVTVDDCCRMPRSFSQAVMDKCSAQRPTQMPAPGVPRTEGCCMMQCILTEIGGFANNVLNTDAIKSALAGTLGADATLAPLVGTTVDNCARQIQNDPAYAVAPISASPDRAGCSFVPQGFMNCLHSTLFKSCPSSLWTESSDCQGLKQKIDSGCPFFALRGRGPPN
ncbi:general odorant-binding protein 67-like [Anopheles aquasalis]|uniref:general odorant-binding protein 67-like n=1 Tax=Anopheles aquasalis TaxID=42839 RepID=UPI00215B19C5|nr:general odorant-binding protein 67-like [Anopheles aquasalis]